MPHEPLVWQMSGKSERNLANYFDALSKSGDLAPVGSHTERRLDDSCRANTDLLELAAHAAMRTDARLADQAREASAIGRAPGGRPPLNAYGNRTATNLAQKAKKSAGANLLTLAFLGSPTWARTRDLRINSPALYQLSYRGIEPKSIAWNSGSGQKLACTEA